MYKYIFTLATLLDSKSRIRKKYCPDILISDLFDENLDEIDWIMVLSELELIYGFEIPDELYDRTDLTLEQFAYELSKLPLIDDELYPEFYDIKTTTMKLTNRAIELEVKTDEESIREVQEIDAEFEELTIRLNMILEMSYCYNQNAWLTLRQILTEMNSLFSHTSLSHLKIQPHRFQDCKM